MAIAKNKIQWQLQYQWQHQWQWQKSITIENKI